MKKLTGMENMQQKNIAINDLISRYESNPKETVWDNSKKFMSFVKHALFYSAVAFVDVFRNIDWPSPPNDSSGVEHYYRNTVSAALLTLYFIMK